MRNIVALCATALALASPGVAQAADNFGTDGTYTFAGPVTVQKNLSPATSCNLSVSVAVSGSGTAANVTSAPVLSSGTICPVITFSNLPYSADARGTGGAGSAAEELWLSTVKVNIPPLLGGLIGADACEGVLKVYWIPGSPPEIEFDSPFSDLADTNPDGNLGSTENPCKIIGTLTQTSGPTNLTITI